LQGSDTVQVQEVVKLINAALEGRVPDLTGVPEALAAAVTEVAERIEGLSAEVSDLSPSDELTSLAKENVFNNVLWREFNRSERYKEPLSLVLLEIDDIEKFAAERGRADADRVLRHVASVMLQVIRETDLAARYGDERFVVVMPQTGLDGAREFIGRLRKAVEAGGTEINGGSVRPCVSAGAASVPDDGIRTAPDLVARAAAALELAKGAAHGK